MKVWGLVLTNGEGDEDLTRAVTIVSSGDCVRYCGIFFSFRDQESYPLVVLDLLLVDGLLTSVNKSRRIKGICNVCWLC